MGRVLRKKVQKIGSTPQQPQQPQQDVNSGKKKRKPSKRRSNGKKKKLKSITRNVISPESTHVIETLQETSNQHVSVLKVTEIANDDIINITETTNDSLHENSHMLPSKAIVSKIENDVIDITNITISDNVQSSSRLVPPIIENEIIDITNTTVCEYNNIKNVIPFKATFCEYDDVQIISCSSSVEQNKIEIVTLLDSSDEESTPHQHSTQKPIASKPIKEPLVIPKLMSTPVNSTNTKKRKYSSPLIHNSKRTKLDEFKLESSTGDLGGFVVDKQKMNHHSHNFKKIQHNATTHLQEHIPLSTTTSMVDKRLRPIIIDGLNIGHAHGGHVMFSVKGIELCIKYFVNRGHKDIIAFIPQHRQGPPGSESNKLLNMLDKKGHICYTPSRKVQNERMTCYDDRILLEYAHRCGGVVVSNDNYRDLYGESDAFRDIIENRQVMVTFVRDEIIVPEDQYNRRAAVRSLSDILCFSS